MAEAAGHPGPHKMQHLLSRAPASMTSGWPAPLRTKQPGTFAQARTR